MGNVPAVLLALDDCDAPGRAKRWWLSEIHAYLRLNLDVDLVKYLDKCL